MSVSWHRDLDDAGNFVKTFKISRRFQFSSNLKKNSMMANCYVKIIICDIFTPEIARHFTTMGNINGSEEFYFGNLLPGRG